MNNFKVGDRVYYGNNVDDTGTIMELASSGRWWVMWDKMHAKLSAYEHNLTHVDDKKVEYKKVEFKVGDRVRYLQWIGTIDDCNDDRDGFRVKWDDPNSYPTWLTKGNLELVQKSDTSTSFDQNPQVTDATIDAYTVAEFKKLLDKMDDDLILKMTNLRICFKN